jgi:fused signal recognition particle receptor
VGSREGWELYIVTGGVVVGIREELQIPIKYVCVGEGIDDLRPFDAGEFAEALFSE